MTHYFVYYKLPGGDTAAARPQVQALLAAVESATGIRGRWMRRRDEATTHMEVYENVRDEAAFEAALAREGARLGVARHVERFVDA